MRTADASGDLLEERNHDFLELVRLDHIQYLFQFIQEHYFFRAVYLWPELEQSHDDRFCESWIFLQELDNAIG